MTKYYGRALVLEEVPDEISLALQITNCPHRCHGCHSPELTQNIGIELDDAELSSLLKKYSNKGISCICLMGGDADHSDIIRIADYIHNNSDLKVAMYSGDDIFDDELSKHLDYYKVGRWDETKGPLNKETTNQIMWKISDDNKEDITYKFWTKIKR